MFHADAERRKSRYKVPVPGSLWMLISLTVLFAAAVVAHLAVAWVTIRSDEVTPIWKWLAALPPITPVAAWRAQKKAGAIVWVVLVVSYTVLRIVA